MLLGLAAGKIGDLVFYRDGGEQRTRTRVVPKNPRSFVQMAQRVRIANVSATYRLLKAVLADSFTGRPSNQSGYNAFASSAIEISPYLTREIALADACVPAPYIVSRGVITPIPFDIFEAESRVSLAVSAGGLTAESDTIAAVSSALLSTYPLLRQGDILTFVGIEYYSPVEGDDASAYRALPTIVSMKIDTSDVSALPSSYLESGDGTLRFTLMEELGVAAGAIIVSRVNGDGALQTSPAQLLLSSAATAAYSDFRSAEALNDAVQSYNVGESSILRD